MKNVRLSDVNMEAIIARRIEAILEAHANCLIENLDIGEEALNAMLERAKEPISNDEFAKRGVELIRRRYGLQ